VNSQAGRIRATDDRGRLFYGWWVVAASVVCLAVTGGVQQWSFGAFVPELEAEFGWSRAEVAGAPSIAMLSLAVASPIVGIWVDRWSIRTSVLFGVTMLALCFAALSQVQEIWQFYALYFGSSFFRVWTSYIPFNTLMSRWFVRNRGKAIGLSTAGYGFGGFIFAPLITWLVEVLGWRSAYAVSGLIVVAAVAPLALLMLKDRPSDMGLQPDGDTVEYRRVQAAGAPVAESWTLREAFRLRTFWVLNVAIMLLRMSHVSYGVHGQPLFESRGFSAGAAAALLGGSTLAAALVRASSGFVYDRLSQPRTFVVVVSCSTAAGYLVLLMSTAPPAIALFLVLYGLGAGASPIVPPLILARYFGTGRLGAMFGFTEVTSALMVAGPVAGGAIFDATGSYDWALVLFAGVILSSALLFAVSPAPRKRVVEAAG
jgi:sugar phosphate permease